MNIKVGQKVTYGSGSGMVIGTVSEIHEPKPPYFVQWVSLENIVKKDGTPSKKYKNGIVVNADGIKGEQLTKKVNMLYKGFRIYEEKDITTGCPVYAVYTSEEWKYGKGIRSSEWDATSLEEAKKFVDSYN